LASSATSATKRRWRRPLRSESGAPYGIFANAGIDLGDRMMVFNCRPIHKMAVPIA